MLEKEIDKGAAEIEKIISEIQDRPDVEIEEIVVAVGEFIKTHAKKIVPIVRSLMDLYEAAVEPVVHIIKAYVYLIRDLEKPFNRYVKSIEDISEDLAKAMDGKDL